MTRLAQDILDPTFEPDEWDADEPRAGVLWDAVMDLADHVRALKAELRRLAGPFCERCSRPLTDDDIEGYGNFCQRCMDKADAETAAWLAAHESAAR